MRSGACVSASVRASARGVSRVCLFMQFSLLHKDRSLLVSNPANLISTHDIFDKLDM